MATIATLQRITAADLAKRLLAAQAAPPAPGGAVDESSSSSSSSSSSLAIIDVRDDDYIGGHIKSSLNFPSKSLDATMPTLVRKLAGKDIVVFHCALSQQRGPAAALRYLRERGQEQQQQQQQQVYVLDRGFVGWQEQYGLDERLTEGYRKELWEDGY